MDNKNNTASHESTGKNWYDRYYKLMFVVSIVLLLLSVVYLGYFHNQHGDFIYKDSSLAGGTTITLNTDVPVTELKEALQKDFPDVNVREIKELSSGKRIALLIDTISEPEPLKEKLEAFLGYKLDETNSSLEFTGSSLSQNFYKQLIIAIIISFVLIGLVVFYLFRNVIRSIAILVAVFANITMSLTLVNLLGISLSAAGIAAFLMLIGYSVDGDILLTSRVLKRREGTVNQRIFGAFKTSIFITITALIGLLPAFFLVTGLPDSFRQIFIILAFGLLVDIINTWFMNAGIIKWYADRKGI